MTFWSCRAYRYILKAGTEGAGKGKIDVTYPRGYRRIQG